MKYFGHSQSEFIYKYIVTMADIDVFRHMSYANYVRLLFLASDAFLLPSLSNDFLNSARIIATKTKMNFKYQTKLGDHVLIKVNSSDIGTSSFALVHKFSIEDSGIEVGTGSQSFVLEGLDLGQSCGLSESLRSSLRQIEIATNSNVLSHE